MSKYLQHVKFEGLITYQTYDRKKVKLSITDTDTATKLKKILGVKKYKDLRVPVSKDTYQVILGSRTKITSEDGKEDVDHLPKVVGWRVTGKLLIKKYSFKSTLEPKGELVEGVTLNVVEIHLGS